jgi:hypothetical protein
MQVSTRREKSVDRETIRAVEGEWVAIWVNHVKADKWEQHEHFVHDLLMPATEQADPDVLRHTRFLHPRQQNEDGTYTSVWLMDPSLEGGDYDMLSLLQKAYGEEKGEEYLQLWRDSLVGRAGHLLIQSPW